VATPFVQGQLRKEPLSVSIETSCAQSAQPMHITIDSDLQFRVEEAGADPWVFLPMVNFAKLREPNIIEVF
jgi:hypothetical protein